MRIGMNPQKGHGKIKLEIKHRVIVVVYIPELDGYYAKTLEVFKLCLNSLIKNNSGTYNLTIVNNGSCSEVKDLLDSYSEDEIDCVIKYSSNIGKIDALIGAARASREKYITLTDSDILFLKNWDSETMKVFQNFNDVGSVSPIPFRHGLYYGTSSTLKAVILKKVKFYWTAITENFEDHNKYLTSINWGKEKDSFNIWPVIESNNIRAIIGSGHQVLTLKRDLIFNNVPSEPSLTFVGEDSEYRYVDEPVDKAGLMRLSTFNNYAFHMGNNPEPWMYNLPKRGIRTQEQESLILNDANSHSYGYKKKIQHKLYVYRKHFYRNLFKFLYSG